MLAGVELNSFQLEWDNGPVCVFDCKFSPDGLRCAAVDSYGFLTIMGFGSNELYKKVLASTAKPADDPLPHSCLCGKVSFGQLFFPVYCMAFYLYFVELLMF